MDSKQKNRKIIYLILIWLCLILIFFVWRAFNPETWSRHLSLTTHWIQNFRKWLDVSGWTKLVYKISYDKYEEVYEWQELENVKRDIQNIILKNIDNRVSALGVSDYKAYVENMDWTPYIVVEIWWIADLDQAKEIIWKTVELEFKLPIKSEVTSETIAARQVLATNLRSEIIESNWNMEKLTEWKWSSNIFYSHLTWATLSELPEILRNDELNNIELNKISEIKEWLFESVSYQDLSGSIQKEDYEWFTFFKINDRKEVSIDNADTNDILTAVEQLWKEYDTIYTKNSDIKSNSYEITDWNLVYNLWEIAEWSKLYDAKIVQVITETATLWSTWEDSESINTANEEKIQNIVETIKTSNEFDSEYATLIADDRLDWNQVDAQISNIDTTKIWEVSTYTSLWTTYVVYLRDVKTEKEHLYTEIVVEDIDKDAFEQALQSQVLYDIEIVFVQDRETRTTAKSNNWNILNWAYFKYATVSQWQMWEPVVAINFDDQGKEIFCDISSENIWNQMAIFVWWEKLSDPVIQAKICGWTAQIDGHFTSESAKELVDNLNNWAMPASLILMQEDKVSPTLWDNALQWALIAALIWIIAIYIYICILYGFKKANITWLVLVTFIIVLAWFMKLVDYALSLSGIAAVILSIWMAVDSNILIYERMNEEKENWKSILSSIDSAYNRSRPAIRDGNISTWLIALLLFMLWSNMFKWFGTMLVVTILLTLLVNVPLTKILLKTFYKNESK